MDSVGGGSRRVLLRGRQPAPPRGRSSSACAPVCQTQGLNPSTGADLGIANADKDFGYQLGFLARFNLPILYIQPELMYTSHRFTMNLEGDASAKVSMKNLEPPVMVGMKIAVLRVMAGPVFNLMNDTKNKLKKTSMAVTADITRPLVSYQLGAGIELGHIGFDVRYGGQFKRADMTVVKGENPASSGKLGMNQWQFTLSYLF